MNKKPFGYYKIKENVYAEAKKYQTRSAFKKGCSAGYNQARKQGWLNGYTWMGSKDKKPNGYWNNYEHCKNEATKYSSISEFAKYCSSGAKYSRDNGWLCDFFDSAIKPKGYWNNYEHCKDVASTYKTLSEFSKKSPRAYYWSRKNNWLQSFDWFVDKSLYPNSKVDCVYAYEFIEYNSVYIGRTLMRRIKQRDREHRESVFVDNHNQKHYIKDAVSKFAKDKKCGIPIIKILETNLTIKNGKIKEGEYCEKYKKEGWILLNKAKTGEFSSSIGSLGRGKWTKEKCRNVALTCKSLSEFKRMYGGAYEHARINNWLEDYDWFISTKELLSGARKNKKWTYQACYDLAKQCRTVSEFQYKSSRAYSVAKEYGWFDNYTWFVNGFSLMKPHKWTEEKCLEIALECSTKKEFKSKNESAYQSARKNGWINTYSWFQDGKQIGAEKRRKYNYEICFEIAKRYKTKTDFKQDYGGAYKVARVNDWLKDYNWFENGRLKDRKWTFDSIQNEASQFLYKRDFMLNSNIAYRKAKDKKYINKLFTNMRFNFNGYFTNSGFELEINSNVNFKDFEFIIFSEPDSQKKIFNFYKEEMQQSTPIGSYNFGRQFIELTGFYDIFPKRPSWNKFKNEICPIIIYSYIIQKDVILLTPINVNCNNEIFKLKKDKILKL